MSDAKLPEITIGETICVRIKQMYFADKSWDKNLEKTMANTLTKIKKLARTYYPGEDDVAILRKIAQFNDNDFREMIDLCAK